MTSNMILILQFVKTTTKHFIGGPQFPRHPLKWPPVGGNLWTSQIQLAMDDHKCTIYQLFTYKYIWLLRTSCERMRKKRQNFTQCEIKIIVDAVETTCWYDHDCVIASDKYIHSKQSLSHFLTIQNPQFPMKSSAHHC